MTAEIREHHVESGRRAVAEAVAAGRIPRVLGRDVVEHVVAIWSDARRRRGEGQR